ncbi:MAG: hypothetical protein LC099_06555 [Anaerolineales bacterium]|nr:hypothetical protein [Anaerolineales bacterium]
MTPLFFAFFFGIFQLFGGMAFGRGLASKQFSLAFLGIVFGGGASLFDVFLFRGEFVLLGFLGVGAFILAAILVYAFWRGAWFEKNEKSLTTLLMGVATVALGIGIAPILIRQARSHELGFADWFFGSCIGILPFFVGFNFIWAAAKALRSKRTFDDVADEEQNK